MRRIAVSLCLLFLTQCSSVRELIVPCSDRHPCNVTPANLRPPKEEPIPDGAIGFEWICGTTPPADPKTVCMRMWERRGGRWIPLGSK